MILGHIVAGDFSRNSSLLLEVKDVLAENPLRSGEVKSNFSHFVGHFYSPYGQVEVLQFCAPSVTFPYGQFSLEQTKFGLSVIEPGVPP